MPNGQILTIQDMIQDIIESEPDFSTYGVYQRKEGQVQSIISEAQAIEIGLPKLLNDNPNQPGPYYTSIHIPLRVFFNRTVGTLTHEPSNGAELLAAAIHLNPFDGLSEQVYTDRATVEHTEDGNSYSIKTLNLITAGGVQLDRPTVATPQLSGTSTVTATCATPGAAMFYTLDGSVPSARNPSATLYTAPVAVSSGQTIKVSAGLEGYFRSIASYTRP